MPGCLWLGLVISGYLMVFRVFQDGQVRSRYDRLDQGFSG